MTGDPSVDLDLEKVDFASLRRIGIEMLQGLSGDLWTDYNLHDPGVTILEQLIYALTELDYVASFPVADYLTGDDGGIDYAELALHPPHQAFPARPTTREDYRRVFLDACPELDDATVEPASAWDPGLHRLWLIPAFDLNPAEQAEVIDRVETIFHQCRNIGEDLAEPPSIQPVRWARLEADIEIDAFLDPAAILAEIYSRVREELVALANFAPFEMARQDGQALDETFTGPLLQSGLWQGESAKSHLDDPSSVNIVSAIQRTHGVQMVRSVSLRAEHEPTSRDRSWHWSLRVPAELADIGVVLRSHGRPIRINGHAFNQAFERIATKRIRIARTQQDPTACFKLPSGQVRDFTVYHSVQHEFPAIYGLSRQRHDAPQLGPLAANETAVSELRGYLVQYDQTLANFARQVDGVKDLFSANLDCRRTYRMETLAGADVPGLDEVYPANAADLIREIEHDFDAFVDRKGRAIDYLLALHGEVPKRPPRAIDGTIDGEDRAWLDTRLAFLKTVPTIGRDRVAGANIQAPEAGPGGYQRRLEALLGIGGQLPATGAVEERTGDDTAPSSAHVYVVEHILLRPSGSDPSPDRGLSNLRITVVISATTGRNGDPQWREFVEMTVTETTPAHLLADVLWLEDDDMCQFRALYADWQTALDRIKDAQPMVTAEAQHLMAFLVARLKDNSEGTP